MADARGIGPDHGVAGHHTNIRGTGLASGNLKVQFGSTDGLNPFNPGGSAQQIHVDVPAKAGGDPATVTVKVFVDGAEAAYPSGPLTYTYEGAAAPAPAPTVVPQNVIVRQNDELPPLNFTGTNLTANGRTVSSVTAKNNGAVHIAEVSNVTNTGFTATFIGPFPEDPDTRFIIDVAVSDPAVPGGFLLDGGTITTA